MNNLHTLNQIEDGWHEIKSRTQSTMKNTLKPDAFTAQLSLFEAEDDSSPFRCKCQTLTHNVLGDGCDICNPELAKELEEEY